MFLGSGDQHKSSLKNMDVVFGSDMYDKYIYKLYVKYEDIKYYLVQSVIVFLFLPQSKLLILGDIIKL